MKRIAVLGFLVIFTACILTEISSCTKTDEPGWFVSKRAGFAIKYPEDWTVTVVPETWVPVVEGESPLEDDRDEFNEYIAVDVIELPSKMSLDEYYRKYHEKLVAESMSFEQHEDGEVKINGEQAKYLLYDKEMPEAYWRVLAYVLVRGKRAYVISCAAENRQFSRHQDQFLEVAHTFRFK
jgi:hypothetical protein